MDQLITIEEAAEFLKNPPSVSPRPDFAKVRALRKHIIKALKQLECPQSIAQGWTGLVMDPALYILLEPNAFVTPVSPGGTAIYPQFAAPAQMKMIDNVFARNKNYYLSYTNINRACFRMLDETVPDRYKVSNTPNMTGWNATMSLRAILDQLMANYGMPDAMVLFSNDTLFRSPFPSTEAPEMLFYRTEQCQEIQIIGQDPYSPTHIINVVVRLLMQSGIFPLKEFETWDAMPNKTYPGLKTFIHEAYTRRLTAISLRNTAGSLGYVGTNANAFAGMNSTTGEETDDDDATTVTQAAAAATTGSTLGNTYATTGTSATFPAEVTAAIQQLAANQTSIMQQFAAFTVNNQPPPNRRTIQVPPITNITVPQTQYGGFQPHTGRFQQGRGGRQGGGRGYGGGRGGRGGGRAPNTYGHAPGGIPQYVPQIGRPQNNQGPSFNIPPAAGRQANGRASRINPAYSNKQKWYNNWNVCYSHGFDVEDWHTSATCGTRKMDHQEGFTRDNAQAYIEAGYAPSTKGMHRNILPTEF